jgi:hypothetical protein
MPPKLADKTKRIELFVDMDLYKRITEWRLAQPETPKMSVAIRRLIGAGLKASPNVKPKKKS